MAGRYLHTMLRVTNPEQSRVFYEALGREFRRESPIVRGGELEATLYFYGFPGQEEELELTFNHDGSTYELGTAYGHIALAVDDMAQTLEELKAQGIEAGRGGGVGGGGGGGGGGAVPRPRRRRADLLRPGSGRLPRRADRPQREVAA